MRGGPQADASRREPTRADASRREPTRADASRRKPTRANARKVVVRFRCSLWKGRGRCRRSDVLVCPRWSSESAGISGNSIAILSRNGYGTQIAVPCRRKFETLAFRLPAGIALCRNICHARAARVSDCRARLLCPTWHDANVPVFHFGRQYWTAPSSTRFALTQERVSECPT